MQAFTLLLYKSGLQKFTLSAFAAALGSMMGMAFFVGVSYIYERTKPIKPETRPKEDEFPNQVGFPGAVGRIADWKAIKNYQTGQLHVVFLVYWKHGIDSNGHVSKASWLSLENLAKAIVKTHLLEHLDELEEITIPRDIGSPGILEFDDPPSGGSGVGFSGRKGETKKSEQMQMRKGSKKSQSEHTSENIITKRKILNMEKKSEKMEKKWEKKKSEFGFGKIHLFENTPLDLRRGKKQEKSELPNLELEPKEEKREYNCNQKNMTSTLKNKSGNISQVLKIDTNTVQGTNNQDSKSSNEPFSQENQTGVISLNPSETYSIKLLEGKLVQIQQLEVKLEEALRKLERRDRKYKQLKAEQEELYVALAERALQVNSLKQQLGIAETTEEESHGTVESEKEK